MKKIRKNIFETNSSSSHSIVLFNEEKTKVTDIYILPGDFGEMYHEYRDFTGKASYIYTYALLEQNANVKDEIKDRLSKVIKEELGADVKFALNESYNEYGYIDDRSDDVCRKVAFDEEKMKLFLFNEGSVLIIDHD